MMAKCRFCRSVSEEGESICPVCGLDKTKSKEDLPGEQRSTAAACWQLRLIGALHVGIGAFVLLGSLMGLILLAAGRTLQNVPVEVSFHPVRAVTSPLTGIFLILHGLSMRRYRKWSFYGAVAFYGLWILTGIMGSQFVIVTVLIFVLYFIVRAPARKVLLR